MANNNAGMPAHQQGPMKDRMREQGSQVAHGAANTGQKLAHTAAEQGRMTTQEAGRKARGLVDQAQAEVKGQAADQQHRAASGLRTIGDQLRSMADKSEQPGMATDLVHQTSDRVQHVAEWLEQREPGQVVEEVRNFARRHPGTFLTGAAIAGVLAGRLTRSMASGGHGDGDRAAEERGRTEMAYRDTGQPEMAQPAGART